MVTKRIPQEHADTMITSLKKKGLEILSIVVDPSNFMYLIITAYPTV